MSDNNLGSHDSQRYWHGSPGDRYEHPNPWPQGGSSPAHRASWALTPEMMAADAQRRNSGASGNSNANTNGSGSPTTPSLKDRRRSSASSGAGLFTGLHSQKRESPDMNMTARRESWNEQRQQPGFFSKLWDEYTRGTK